MLRIVLDTNVLISAVISEGKTRQLVRLASEKRFVLIKSEEIVREFARVLQRKKFRMTGQQVLKAKNALAKTGKTVKVTSRRKVVREDPEDDIFLNTPLDGNADYIITGDPHLLNLASYKGVQIETVDFMLKKLGY